MGNGNNFYVAPNVSSSGDGSFYNPWNLQTALNHPAAVQPGDIIYLRGGNYGSGAQQFNSYLNGSSGNYIIVKPYPEESVRIQGGFFVTGAYTTYMGMEFMNMQRSRESNFTGSAQPDISLVAGFELRGDHNNVINCVLRDLRRGIGSWVDNVGGILYGNVINNNGWDSPDRGHGHDIYSQNETGTQTIKDNIVFNNFSGYNLHLYTKSKQIIGYDI